MTMGTLQLHEHKLTPAVALTPEQRDLLLQLVPKLSIMPTPGQTEVYDLTPGSYVGAVQVGDFAVEIQPKVPVERVFLMLSYALGEWKPLDNEFLFDEEVGLVEAIVPAFVDLVKHALRKGILQGYRSIEESLQTVRGRIRFGDQIRWRFGLAPPIEVRHDEYTEDIEENRLIKAAITRLGRLRIRSFKVRASLRSFDAALARVATVHYDRSCLPEITYNRLNERYRSTIELAKVILRDGSLDLRSGKVSATAVIFDMNRVVEDFVVEAFRDALGLSERSFVQGAKGRHIWLDEARSLRLEPDISWWDGDTCRFVGDVKYKVLSETTTRNSDVYQLLAYTIATGLPTGMLVYAGLGDKRVTHRITLANKRIVVRSLNLAGRWTEVLEQIAAFAEEIRAMPVNL